MNELGGAASAAVSVPNTHYVKQLTATYLRNAGLSLTGPTAMEEQQRSKYNRFKLADDVVISKVYRDDPSNGEFAGARKTQGHFEPNEQVLEQLSKIALMRSYQEQMMQHAEKEGRERSRERQLVGRARQNSGQGERGAGHLSGEQIRKLRESQKAAERARAEEERRLREGKEQQGRQGQKSAFKSPQAVGGSTLPIMSSNDRSWSELEETTLEGEQISCFAVGGEFRLCLPQILNSVLEKVSLQAINQACDELQIFCSTCSAEQLQVLKDAKVLPVAAHQCGLITKSDAERLCSHLLDKSPPRASVFDPKSSPFSFKVQHECFGRCEGLVLPEAYTSPTARCVECLQCEGLFSPQKFVCHSHSSENRTCHWGFDSSNWLTYLQLSEDYTKEERERHTKVMEDFKNRYLAVGSGKRRQDDDYEKPLSGPTKRPKLENSMATVSPMPDPYTAYAKAINYAKAKASLSQGWPWGGKAALGGFPGPPSYPPGPPAPEFRRPEELRAPSPSPSPREDRYTESPAAAKPKFCEKPETEVTRQPALAEEISTVAEALAGAPKHATETVLKILERLTQRLDKAERDRDLAFGKYKELQTRYVQLEEELAKKRGELRELLRQDCRARPASQEERTAELVAKDEVEEAVTGEVVVTPRAPSGTSLTVIVARLGEGREEEGGSRVREPSNTSTASTSDQSPALGTPRLEVKSPSRLLEEPPVSPPRGSEPGSEAGAELEESLAAREELLSKFHKHLGHKSKDPEDALPHIQDRMVKMEAELTALREALSTNRPDKPEPSGGAAAVIQTVGEHSGVVPHSGVVASHSGVVRLVAATPSE